MQQEKPNLKAEREARLWQKVRHPKRPPGTPRKQWEAELRAAFSELGVHGPIQAPTRTHASKRKDRVRLTAQQTQKRWQTEAQAARRALDKSGVFWRSEVQDRERGYTERGST